MIIMYRNERKRERFVPNFFLSVVLVFCVHFPTTTTVAPSMAIVKTQREVRPINDQNAVVVSAARREYSESKGFIFFFFTYLFTTSSGFLLF